MIESEGESHPGRPDNILLQMFTLRVIRAVGEIIKHGRSPEANNSGCDSEFSCQAENLILALLPSQYSGEKISLDITTQGMKLMIEVVYVELTILTLYHHITTTLL